ncbi:hypothetical protein J2T57_001558 [Natronocella acetinitrilica]|uniref:Uncharacterized protein n=1 Tax=Natronocella acetinitrilica TaxID=414046 RepID=A0AAE3G480_9GAMM|nr:hypothetical protein [Natronocella acetinitrilica]MCP1674456.1 hypothetical protein [Natronocella acetinitrilica]
MAGTLSLLPRITPAEPGSGQGREFDYTLPNGRRFNVLECERDRYFLCELIPSGRVVTSSPAARVPHAEDHPVLKAILREKGPNAVCETAQAAGIDPNDMVLSGAGVSAYARFHASRAACENEIFRVVAEDVWYQHEDPALKRDPEHQAALAAQDAAEREAYQRAQQAQCAEALAAPGLFRGCHNLHGPLSQETQRAILAYLNAPNEARWEAISGLIIGPAMTTLWQAWSAVDPRAPVSLPLEADANGRRWPRLPEPECLREAIRRVGARAEALARGQTPHHEGGP